MCGGTSLNKAQRHPQTTDENVCQECQSLDRTIFQIDGGLYHVEKTYWDQVINLIPVIVSE